MIIARNRYPIIGDTVGMDGHGPHVPITARVLSTTPDSVLVRWRDGQEQTIDINHFAANEADGSVRWLYTRRVFE